MLRRSVFLYGPPGCGKTSVGRVLAKRLRAPLLDVDDDLLEQTWGCSVAAKLEQVGEEAFLELEDKTLGKLRLDRPHVVSLTGSNPLMQAGFDRACAGADVVFLDVETGVILDRLERMKVDRIVGMKNSTLKQVLDARSAMYEKRYTLRVTVAAGETPEQISDKVEAVLATRGSCFESTRSAAKEMSFTNVLVKGLADDGGLILPDSNVGFLPREFERLKDLSYPQLCKRVLEKFHLQMSPADLEECINGAYASFDDSKVLPLRRHTSDLFTLETWHGPTASFKDLSLQLLPRMLARKLEQERQALDGCIVATSGDTGSAALDGFAAAGTIPVVVLFPENGVSEVQKLQMTQARRNALVIGVAGADFDYCQSLVKKILNQPKMTDGAKWTSANSINLGRLLPQIVFSVSAYCSLLRENPNVSEFDMAIPTGNFGNILAAILAKRMGLPLRQIVLASNDNNVLSEFINTGVYDLRGRKFQATISPSIDILVSSNLERWLYLLLDRDHAHVAKLMSDLRVQGHFRVSNHILSEIQSVVKAGWCSQQQCIKSIKKTFDEHNLILDPHTAVARHVADQFASPGVPMVLVSTAHWAKFSNSVGQAMLGQSKSSSSLEEEWTRLQNDQNKVPIALTQLLKPQKTGGGPKVHIVLPADESAIIKTIQEFLTRNKC